MIGGQRAASQSAAESAAAAATAAAQQQQPWQSLSRSAKRFRFPNNKRKIVIRGRSDVFCLCMGALNEYTTSQRAARDELNDEFHSQAKRRAAAAARTRTRAETSRAEPSRDEPKRNELS